MPWSVIYVQDPDLTLYEGDALAVLNGLHGADVQSVVTSPPYMDSRPEYPSPSAGAFELIFRELAEVCDPVRATMAWNVGRRWRDRRELLWWIDLIIAAERAGWTHRDTRLWLKPNANPIQGEICVDSHEYVLLFAASPEAEFNTDAIRVEYQPGSIERMRRRYVSSVSVKGDTVERNGQRREEKRGMTLEAHETGARAPSYFIASVGREKGNAHPAPMPLELAIELVRLTSWPGDVVLDPFAGSGTTLLAARLLGRPSIGIELQEEYCELASRRLAEQRMSVLA